MINLLIGGAADKGKTSTIRRITQYLINQKGFEVLDNGIIPENVEGEKPKDFTIRLKGRNKLGVETYIINNTCMDYEEMVDYLFDFIKNNQADILISAIRDIDFRDYFFTHLIDKNDFTLEVPLAKINYNWGKREEVIEQWYNPKIDTLIQHILSQPPFNL